MAADKNPFGFDMDKMMEMLRMSDLQKMFDPAKMPMQMPMQMPMLDFGTVMEAQQKNMAALVEANKIALAGYQDVYQRQVALYEQAMQHIKAQLDEAQTGQPMSAEQMSKNMEGVKSAFDQALAHLREIAETAQHANMSAFEVMKNRMDEMMAEMSKAADDAAG